MIDESRQVWLHAFNVALSSGRGVEFATIDAEKAVEAYDKRWNTDQARVESLSGGTLDGMVIQRALERLKADGRWEALLVLTSLYEALKESQATGQRLVEWTPPPRGAQI